MKIYIPEHLKEIPIISSMVKMLEEYSTSYYQSEEGSFDNYRYQLKIDPVKKFLGLCVTKEMLRPEEDLEEVLTYLSCLFYSVKGTIKIFDYMKKHLGLTFVGEIVYTTDYIDFTLTDLNVDNESYFNQALLDFLDALLYFRSMKGQYGTIRLEIVGESKSYMAYGIRCYTEKKAEPYEIS